MNHKRAGCARSGKRLGRPASAAEATALPLWTPALPTRLIAVITLRPLAFAFGAWTFLVASVMAALLMALLCRVEIRSDHIDIALSQCRLTELLAGSLDLKMEHRRSRTPPEDLLTLTLPASLKRAGREMRVDC